MLVVVGDGYVYYLDHSDGFTDIHKLKFIKWYTLNMCHALYFSPNFMKLFLTNVEIDPKLMRIYF